MAWFLLPTTQSSWTLTTSTSGCHLTKLLYLVTPIQILIQSTISTVIWTQKIPSLFTIRRSQWFYRTHIVVNRIYQRHQISVSRISTRIPGPKLLDITRHLPYSYPWLCLRKRRGVYSLSIYQRRQEKNIPEHQKVNRSVREVERESRKEYGKPR